VTLATYQPNPLADQKQILTTIHLFSKHIQLANDILIEFVRQYFVRSLINYRPWPGPAATLHKRIGLELRAERVTPPDRYRIFDIPAVDSASPWTWLRPASARKVGCDQ